MKLNQYIDMRGARWRLLARVYDRNRMRGATAILNEPPQVDVCCVKREGSYFGPCPAKLGLPSSEEQASL
jgi:hypothetical protein